MPIKKIYSTCICNSNSQVIVRFECNPTLICTHTHCYRSLNKRVASLQTMSDWDLIYRSDIESMQNEKYDERVT